MPINPPKDCKTKEFNICKGATLCIKNAALVKNAALEGIPSGLLDSLSVNCPSTTHVNNAKSAANSDTNNMVQSYSTLPNSSAFCDRMQCASDTAPGYLFQTNERRAQVEILQVNRKTGQPQRVTVLPHKTKKPSNLLHEKHEFKKCSPPNKNGVSSSQNCKGLHKSIISRSKTVLDLGSPKRLQVETKVGQTIDKKGIEVHKQVPFSVPPWDPCTSLNTTNPSVDRILENVKFLHKRSNECHVAPIVDRNNSDMLDVNVHETPFVDLFCGCLIRGAYEPVEDMTVTKSQGTDSKRRASETSVISLNHEIKLEGKRQQSFDTQVNTPCKNRRFEEPAVTGGISSQLDIDLELDKGRQQIEDMSLLNISANAPECCKPNEFNVCKVLAVCSETAALKVMPTAMYNNRPLNYPSSVHVNNTKSIVESDPGSALQSPCTLTNSRALCDRKQAGSITPPDNEEQPQVTVSQVDRENRKMRRVTIVPQKRKKSLKLLNERHGSKNHGPPNRNELSSQKFKRDKSTGSSNNYVFHLNSPKGQQAEVNAGQIIGNEDMKVQEKAPLSVNSSCHPHISLSTSDLCVEKIPEQVKSLHTRLIERHEVPVVDLKNYDMADPRDSRTPSVTSFSANSSKVACEPGKDKAATEYQLKALNRKVTGTISMNQEFNLNGKRQQKFDICIEPPCENRSLQEPAITGGVNGEPDIEKIISEVIQTTQRYCFDVHFFLLCYH